MSEILVPRVCQHCFRVKAGNRVVTAQICVLASADVLVFETAGRGRKR